VVLGAERATGWPNMGKKNTTKWERKW